jgi:hypothetical protein
MFHIGSFGDSGRYGPMERISARRVPIAENTGKTLFFSKSAGIHHQLLMARLLHKESCTAQLIAYKMGRCYVTEHN